jgi:acyl carrier protein
MTTQEIEAALIAAIEACLEASGKPKGTINSDTVPLKDISGFDSLCAVEVIIDLEATCGVKADSNVFVEGEGRKERKRTIREIAIAINR